VPGVALLGLRLPGTAGKWIMRASRTTLGQVRTTGTTTCCWPGLPGENGRDAAPGRSTGVNEDGSDTLAQRDVLIVITALRDAMTYRQVSGEMITKFRAVAFALGDD
jgi:hypothetical protein